MSATFDLRREGVAGIPKYALAHLGMNSAHFSMAHDFNGPTFDVGAACAGGAYALGIAHTLIRAGLADVMVAGGAEAPVNPLGIASFDRLGAHTRSQDPAIALAPFSQRRRCVRVSVTDL